MSDISQLRRDYGQQSLLESEAAADPYQQFQRWFEDIAQTPALDPSAMVLSTVDEHGHPDARVVLLKRWDEAGFVFFTHYESPKAQQLAHQPMAALTFYWPELSRQVRLRGGVEKIAPALSEAYFQSRSKGSQVCATVLTQSQSLPDRRALTDAVAAGMAAHEQQPVSYPANWGGYCLSPTVFEFFQGRDERMHDRLQYLCVQGQWSRQRLAP